MRELQGALSGKVCVVTGAGRGQGRASALRFAEEGARVVVAEVDVASGTKTASIIVHEGGESLFIPIDVSNGTDWEILVSQVLSKWGRIDVLYNNAAILHPRDGSILEMEEDVWDRVIAVNVKGLALGCRSVLPSMLDLRSGSIINTSSLRAELGASVSQDAYVSSKGAILSLTRSLAVQFGPSGVRANAILLGTIDTPMISDMPIEARSTRLARYPLGRFGLPEDVAALAVFLASDASSWMTGATVALDGGASIKYI